MKNGNRQTHSIYSNVRYILGIVWREQRSVIPLTLLCAALGVVMPFFGIFLPRIVVQAITDGNEPAVFAAMVGGFTAAGVVIYFSASYLQGHLYWMRHKLRNGPFFSLFMKKTLTCDYSFLESANGQMLMQRMIHHIYSGDWSSIGRILDAFLKFLTGLLGFTLYSAVLKSLGVGMVLFLAAVSCLSYFTLQYINRYEERNKPNWKAIDQKIDYINYACDDVQPAKDIRLYDMAGWFSKMLDQLIGERTVWFARVENRRLAINTLNVLTFFLRDCAAYGYVIYRCVTGSITVADLVFFFGAVAGFSQWVNRILSEYAALGNASIGMTEVRNFLEAQDAPPPEKPAKLPDAQALSIEFDDVTFTYPGSGHPTLKNLNLTIRAGEKLALVGVNGAGKTTLMKLLCGFYRPDSGCIWIDGTDISRFRKEELYTLFSAVFQDITLLPCSVRQNVAMQENAKIDDDRVRRCLDMVDLLKRVEREPGGIDSPMLHLASGKGAIFSGGETQRLLMARALYRDTPILLLDEPTSALDPIAESEIYAQYHDMAHSRTSIFISHRLASTRFCDAVALMKDGRIEEYGTHGELLEKNGEYARLFEIQSHYYKKNLNEDSGEEEELHDAYIRK